MMTNIEIYIDKFPQYKFYGIEVENKFYYGEADKDDGVVTIFINILQPEWQQLNTIIHEAAHAEFDVFGDSKRWSMKTMLAEKQAQYITRHFHI